MTVDQAVEHVKRYTVHGGLLTWGAHVFVGKDEAGNLLMMVTISVHDRDDTTRRIPIVFNWIIDKMQLKLYYTEKMLDAEVRNWFHMIFIHEMQESLQFDGKRVYDPHPEDVRP